MREERIKLKALFSIFALAAACALLFANCGEDSSSGEAPAATTAERGLPGAEGSEATWQLTVDIDNGELAVDDLIEAQRTTWIGGHTVDVHNGPAGCLWNDTTDTLNCEIVIENLSDQCMSDVRTRFHDSTNPSAIMTGVDYVWPGPSVVPNTAQPINETGYCITEAGPSSAGSSEGCSNTWQASIPPGGIASQQFVFTNVPVGQYQVYLEVFANYQACSAPAGMAVIPAGCFNMGDSSDSCSYDADECPVHNVCVTSDFYMDVHEVTNAEYAACVSGGGCTPPINTTSFNRSFYYGNPVYDNFPVIYVSWNQATAYCTWAGKRLPTEAEWEYAARGGLSGKRYPWGDSIVGADANYSNSGDPWDNDTSEVEYYAANGYGLYDMSGNVSEWLNDWYLNNYYVSSPADDPIGPASGGWRVNRGGAFSGPARGVRVADRFYNSPPAQGYTIGFRCAVD